jgi:pimeloyl-ACP methyl ester carboxylesterase
VIVVTILLVAGFGLELAVTYFDTPHHGTDASIERVEADPTVEVERLGGGYVLRPAGGESAIGLVFYPGGRVHPDAYLASLSPLASRANVTVYVTKMPLNLAIFGQGAAGPIVRDHPEVDTWYVGGHSLGGAMACRYASGHADRVDGVVLLASYCDRNVSDASFRALSVTGTADRVLNRDRYLATRSNLPADAQFVTIRGMNHSQFGSYTGQRGGGPATIDFDTAHDRLGEVLLSWIENSTRNRAVGRIFHPVATSAVAVNFSRARPSTGGNGRRNGTVSGLLEVESMAAVRGDRARDLRGRRGHGAVARHRRGTAPVRGEHRRHPRRNGVRR